MATNTAVDVVMPQMGVSVSEGTISRWLKQEGEQIEKDETLLEISTDKVDTEVPSPASGTVSKILVPEGETVDVGAKLAEISAGGAAGAASQDEPKGSATEEATAEPSAVESSSSEQLSMERKDAASEGEMSGSEAQAALEAPAASSSSSEPPLAPNGAGTQDQGQRAVAQAKSGGAGAPSAPVGSAGSGKTFVSPVVARIAAEHGIDPAQVPGTGSGGRVTKKDILGFVESGGAAQAGSPSASPSAPAASPGQAAPAAPSRAAAPAPAAQAAPAEFSGGERVVNFNPMRKAIARHMIDSTQTSAHVTSTVEVDMTRVVAMRNQIKSEVMQTWGTKLTVTHFTARAVIDAIAQWPLINAEIRGDSAVIKSYVNLGIAVALDRGEGLIVPVVKNAEEKNLVGLARSINDLAERARSKKLSPDDVQGGTFTITNPGVFGAIHGTPIINQPQVAILDTEAIVKRPVVLTDEHGNDSIAIRSMMNLCMSYDHRLIDGAYAVQFLAHVKRNLQEWDIARFQG